MKSIIITSIFVFFTVIGMNAQAPNVDKFTVEINGMGCPYCASGIENEFKKLADISNIKIDIKTGTLTFNYPNSKSLQLEEVRNRVKKAGYTLASAKAERANGKTENLQNAEPVSGS